MESSMRATARRRGDRDARRDARTTASTTRRRAMELRSGATRAATVRAREATRGRRRDCRRARGGGGGDGDGATTRDDARAR